MCIHKNIVDFIELKLVQSLGFTLSPVIIIILLWLATILHKRSAIRNCGSTKTIPVEMKQPYVIIIIIDLTCIGPI